LGFAPRFLVGLGRDGIRPGAFLRQYIPENILGLCAQLFHDRGLAARGTQLENGGKVLSRHALVAKPGAQSAFRIHA
jgi:hypothetical protein